MEQLEAALREVHGTVLPDRLFELGRRVGSEVELEPVDAWYAYQRGRWDPAPLIARIRARGYAAIVLDNPTQVVPPVRAAILETYRLRRCFDNRFLQYRMRSCLFLP